MVARLSSAQVGLAHLSIELIPRSLTTSASAFEVFGPVDHLLIEVRLSNEESGVPLIVDSGFFQAIQWELNPPQPVASAGRSSIPLPVARVEELTCGPGPAVCDPLASTRIDPDGWIEVRLRIQPAAGVLRPGEYMLAIDPTLARQRLHQTDGQPWNNRSLERHAVPLVIRALRTQEDRARYHEVEAAEAMRRRDYTSALAHSQQITAENPRNSAADARSGWALIQLGRFAEATVVLERAWSGQRNELAGLQLALAFFALGRDADAEAVLNQLYDPATAQEEVKRVRQSGRALAARRR
jgi:tetratricopeptide (TPR) repeat protein